jgi:phytoene dehydrogenase-like protein
MPASPVIVVGAGISGLVCAIELHRAGHPVLVLEGADDVGGRVRSTVVDGFVLDHGFQVLFTAYPTLASYLDLPALAPRRFLPAARVVRDGRMSLIGDALRDPALLAHTVFARAITMGDKLRLLALRRFAMGLTIDDCFSARFDAMSTRELLLARGFGTAVIEGFFAPFYGGILLDRTLATSASALLFTFKMLAEGDTVVPAAGMGAIATQLASQLPAGAIRIGVPVESLEARDGQVCGVRLADGRRFEADDVVLAAGAPDAAALARTIGLALTVPDGARGCTTVYYATARTVLPGKALWLSGDAGSVISHAVTLTEVAPEYDAMREPTHGITRDVSRRGMPGIAAGTGRCLIAATAVGPAASLPDEALDEGARRDIAGMAYAAGTAPPDGPVAMTRLAIWRVPYAQFAQPPGWRERRPTISCGIGGLWRAGEILHSSSLEGAARGGRDTARALLQRHHAGPRSRSSLTSS